MSDALGPVAYGESSEHQVFLGRDFSHERTYSEEVANEIDKEVRRLMEEAYEASRTIITENRDKLELIAQGLIAHETLTAKQLDELLTTGNVTFDKENDDDDDRDSSPMSPLLVGETEPAAKRMKVQRRQRKKQFPSKRPSPNSTLRATTDMFTIVSQL